MAKCTSKEEETYLTKNLKNKCKTNSKTMKQANNNEEDYESNYMTQDGRVSGSSCESPVSSSSDCDRSFSPSDSASDSSASSSTNRDEPNGDIQSIDEVKPLNTICNIAPKTKEALALVESVRMKFLDSLKDDKESINLYDRSDLEQINLPLSAVMEQEQSLTFRWISRFLDFHVLLWREVTEKDIEEATTKLKDYLQFRNKFRLPHIRADQFCREFYILNGAFPFGRDRQNLPVLYLRARIHRRWSHKLDESFRRYVIWQVDKITKSYAGAKVSHSIREGGIEKDGSFGIVFDCLGVSYSCVDMDFLSFLVKLLVHYYPTYCRYALCVDLPWLFRSVWKLVRSWLPEEARNTVQLITSNQLSDYISDDQIPNSMKHDNLDASERSPKGKHRVPDNWESLLSISELTKEFNISSNEVKQFKAHTEKVSKEYEQLGAI